MSEKRRQWTLVVDELEATPDLVNELRDEIVRLLKARGQQPRTVTVESWLYRQNTERVYNPAAGVEEIHVRVTTLPHRLIPSTSRRRR